MLTDVAPWLEGKPILRKLRVIRFETSKYGTLPPPARVWCITALQETVFCLCGRSATLSMSLA